MSDSSIANKYPTQSLGGQHSRLSRQGFYQATVSAETTGGRSRVLTSIATATQGEIVTSTLTGPTKRELSITTRTVQGETVNKQLQQDHPRRELPANQQARWYSMNVYMHGCHNFSGISLIYYLKIMKGRTKLLMQAGQEDHWYWLYQMIKTEIVMKHVHKLKTDDLLWFELI